MAKISDTSSGRLFLKLFLSAGPFPKTLRGLPRGKAISLTQKLNMYHQRWAKEENEEMKALSAKARGEMNDPANWSVEVSFSPKNAGGGHRKPAEWIEALHAQLREQEEAAGKPIVILAEDGVQEDNPL